MKEHLFPYDWKLSDGYPAKGIEPNGLKVFGTFICGGGSSMGYKLAGFNHIGGVELDQKVAEVYKANHNPKYLFVEDIRDFNKRTDLPDELYNLDILDGSPPCSTFSMAGDREKAWGKEKRFAEGQKLQTLDDLVFIYCDTIEKLKPKVCILENVKGLILGNAKAYSKEIVKRITKAGYRVQLFLLNASRMGVPQERERVFFVGLRNDIKKPPLSLSFKEKPILFSEVMDFKDKSETLTPLMKSLWTKRQSKDTDMSDINKRERGKQGLFSHKLIKMNKVAPTLTTGKSIYMLYDQPRFLNEEETKRIASFPEDYDTLGREICFFTGMSVPPVMTAQLAHQIYLQWFK